MLQKRREHVSQFPSVSLCPEIQLEFGIETKWKVNLIQNVIFWRPYASLED